MNPNLSTILITLWSSLLTFVIGYLLGKLNKRNSQKS